MYIILWGLSAAAAAVGGAPQPGVLLVNSLNFNK